MRDDVTVDYYDNMDTVFVRVVMERHVRYKKTEGLQSDDSRV